MGNTGPVRRKVESVDMCRPEKRFMQNVDDSLATIRFLIVEFVDASLLH